MHLNYSGSNPQKNVVATKKSFQATTTTDNLLSNFDIFSYNLNIFSNKTALLYYLLPLIPLKKTKYKYNIPLTIKNLAEALQCHYIYVISNYITNNCDYIFSNKTKVNKNEGIMYLLACKHYCVTRKFRLGQVSHYAHHLFLPLRFIL